MTNSPNDHRPSPEVARALIAAQHTTVEIDTAAMLCDADGGPLGMTGGLTRGTLARVTPERLGYTHAELFGADTSGDDQ